MQHPSEQELFVILKILDCNMVIISAGKHVFSIDGKRLFFLLFRGSRVWRGSEKCEVIVAEDNIPVEKRHRKLNKK